MDEDIIRECSTACGGGYETCLDGKYQGCDAVQPIAEICNDGVDNDCDGILDNGCDEATADDPNNDGPQDTIEDNPAHGQPADDYGKDTNSSGYTDTPYDTTQDSPDQYTAGEEPKTPVPDTAAGCVMAEGTDRGSRGAIPSALLVLAALTMVATLRRRALR